MPVRDQTDLSFMTVGGAVSHTEIFGENAITGSLSYTNLGPYQQLVPQNLSWEKAPQSLNGEVLYRHRLNKRSLLKLFYTHQRSHLEVYQSTPEIREPKTLVGLTNKFHYANASWENALNDNWLLNAGLSYSHNEDDINPDSLSISQRDNLLHAKAKLTWFATNRLQLTGGTEHFQQSFEETLNGQRRSVHLPLTAGFSEARYHFTSDLVLKAGLRYERNGSAHLMPRVSAAYKAGDDQQFSIAYGEFWQQQEVSDLVISEDLNSAFSRHYIVNYQWASEDITFRVEAFHKDYENLLLNPSDLEATTGGEGYARGFDVFFRDRKTIENTDFWITYSFIDSKRQFGSFTEKVQPGFAPRHNASVVGKYWIEKLNSQPGLTYSFNDGYTYDDPNLPGEQESITKVYSSLSLNWSYLPKPNLIIHFAVNNVLGRENVFGYRYSTQPDDAGQYSSLPISQPADRFFFIGVFLTLSEDRKANQLNNL